MKTRITLDDAMTALTGLVIGAILFLGLCL